jgi:hypothetical protein
METTETSKKAGPATTDVAKAKGEPQLTDISVSRTGATPAKAATKTKARSAAGVISGERRHQLIAEAAYLRAEARGFVGGDPVADWLEAERDIDQRIGQPGD